MAFAVGISGAANMELFAEHMIVSLSLVQLDSLKPVNILFCKTENSR